MELYQKASGPASSQSSRQWGEQRRGLGEGVGQERVLPLPNGLAPVVQISLSKGELTLLLYVGVCTAVLLNRILLVQQSAHEAQAFRHRQ